MTVTQRRTFWIPERQVPGLSTEQLIINYDEQANNWQFLSVFMNNIHLFTVILPNTELKT